MSLAQFFQHKPNDIDELVGKASNQANAMVLLGKMLADSSQNVSEHADDQVQHIEEIAASVEEMNSSIKEVADNASLTMDAATNMTKLNEDGVKNMEQLDKSVHDVASLFEKVTNSMEELYEASKAVSDVVEVINQVALQTNLLSMNASIEAAHAGQYGKGFAVVAHEVRNLAINTVKSTKEITKTIERNQLVTAEVINAIRGSKEAIQESVDKTDKTGKALKAASNEIETVNTMVQQIAAATEEQSAAVDSINANIGQVSQLAQDTFTSATSSHQTSSDLAKVATRLEDRFNSHHLEFLGLVPLENAIKMNKSFAPLCNFIGSILDRRFFVRLGHDYAGAIKDAGEGRSLVSYQTPSTYIEAHEKYGVEALVIPLAKGEPFYRSAIVVRDEPDITEVSQLAGKRFAFGDEKSTGSKAMPESMLKQAGVTLDKLTDHSFAGSHDNVANAVLNKDADAGGLMLSVAENYVGKGLRILAISDEIPQFPICASPDLASSDRNKLVEALVNLKDKTILQSMGKNITGFAPIKDSDYDGVRAMLRNLEG